MYVGIVPKGEDPVGAENSPGTVPWLLESSLFVSAPAEKERISRKWEYVSASL